MKKKVLLAYSGGLDTSVICKWLVLRGYDVVAYVGNVGQDERLDEVAAKATAAGASDVIVDDLRQEFVRDFVWPAVGFQSRYEGRYLLGTALARPVIAKGMVRIANQRNIHIFSHGATGKGNDQIRFELGFYALTNNVEVIAPWRIKDFYTLIRGRKEAIAFAKEQGIPIKATVEKPWSSDGNLMHISFEAGMLEDPATAPRADMFEYTKSPEAAPDRPEKLTLTIEAGLPVAINGNLMPPVMLLEKLNLIGGKHGIGRVDIVESRFIGMKSRGVYETPGATILYAAMRDAECLTVAGELIALKDKLAIDFAALVYKGMWFSPTMDALLAFLKSMQRFVTATVDLTLYKGNVTVTGRTSRLSLYDEAVASMEADDGAYQAEDAAGFIKLHAIAFKREQARKGLR
ncbi:argininosuccinate synthase [Spirochaetota bacterium]|nr:argininosuccinate synthase [Spirochaetota bacterium]